MEEEEQQQQKTILEQVFGESSSDSDSDSGDSDREWKCIEEVKGLWLCTHFLSIHHQSLLLSAIESENWFSDHHPEINQAMRFGHQNLPPWAQTLAHSIRRSAPTQPTTTTFPFQREPLFDQMIVNVYHPGEGIAAHVDLLRFDDGIAIVSLESSCVMHFSPVPESDEPGSGPESVPVLLLPGSLVLMSGEARYRWKHEINRRPGFQSWQGQELSQTRRTSITLRKLCPSQ
ncbi:uncharacterized protein LOC130733187 [Lotus japonicus]|uniref:uncharacterized protein LOC130733187 n=1 Tax=Lotus japonicus TaxID=34305 RepID=UPI002589B4B4|nr:uncharacterized protein LOC130733187 [Lotus japonicus]XP_057441285.1 uncharacterized protein LOC130733187 [Lotus japonicus]